MSSTTTDPNDSRPHDRRSEFADTDGTTDTHSFDLESVVVEYETRTDRCTVYPRERTEEETLTTWLTADVNAFVSLEEMC